MKKTFAFISLLLIITTGCSAPSIEKSDSEKESKSKEEIADEAYEPTVRLNMEKIYCWINAMPNAGNKFHITGEITLQNDDDYILSEISLKEIRIIQKGNIVYYIIPTVKETENKGEIGNRHLIFSTLKGLNLSSNLDAGSPVDVILVFQERDEIFTYRIDGQEVEKAY